jgi:hypothetical protein
MGRVAVQVRAGRETISNRQALLSPRCRFRSVVSFAQPRRFAGHHVLHFTVRFQGNAVLARRSVGPIAVHVR